MLLLTSVARQLFGLFLMAIAVFAFMVGCVFLLPWRAARIRFCNHFGHLMGRTIIWLTGARVTGNPKPAMEARMPAIYVSNHTSALDVFLGIWLSPVGVCGVAKKEVVWYPFFGQLYLISGHLLLDRQNRENAIGAMRTAAELVRKHSLGVWIWPEGTRSRDGRLRPFKKGFVHMAIATGLPVVPVVVTGAHRIWAKNGITLVPGEVGVQVLPPIDTSTWRLETLEDHVASTQRLINDALPPDQQSLPEAAAAK